MDKNRFWEERPTEFRQTITWNGTQCKAIGLVYMRYPIYECPDLCSHIKRPLKKRLRSHLFRKYDSVDMSAWILTNVKLGHHKIEILIVSPTEARELL